MSPWMLSISFEIRLLMQIVENGDELRWLWFHKCEMEFQMWEMLQSFRKNTGFGSFIQNGKSNRFWQNIAPFESPRRLLSNGANFVKNGSVFTFVGAIRIFRVWFPSYFPSWKMNAKMWCRLAFGTTRKRNSTSSMWWSKFRKRPKRKKE